jgi:hypothetical protein
MRPLFTGFSFTARVVHVERDRLVAGKTGVRCQLLLLRSSGETEGTARVSQWAAAQDSLQFARMNGELLREG